MGRVRDASKARFWRRLVRRQAQAGESVARFCAREGVSVHQFHWWRRTLRNRDQQATTDRRFKHRLADAVASTSEPDPRVFVPVRLPFSLGIPIELVHPGGCVVRVPVGFDPQSLQRILASLALAAREGAVS